ncbi:nuclear transport factor 2 family protein [Streptomyces sp. NPDC088197]|uniref:nuclear transport factor 2 family protein n=1 Tax=unclassified Streptomyces TaxID=2593676 RepID=UPI0036EE6799
MTRRDPVDAPGPTPRGPALDAQDVRRITALLTAYCDSVDTGDFARFARLFRDGTWLGMPGADVEDWMRENVLTYDGATHTRHRVHDISLAPGGSRDEAYGTCGIEVTQRFPGERALLVTRNTYADRFRRVDGRWRFDSRTITRRQPGDDSRHRRRGSGRDDNQKGRGTCGSSTA